MYFFFKYYKLFIGYTYLTPHVEWSLHIPLRKHAYSNKLRILSPKIENFQIKILIFFIFLHTPVNPSFTTWKWGLWVSNLYGHVFVMYQRKKCMHMLTWNYNSCTSYLMLLLFGETRVSHRFREQRLRKRASPPFSFFYSQIYFWHART